ncbi:MAG TPA: transglutaminase domain-containing protein [Clostridiales bacterium]|nr:transglutaminase domain-containing protein [Clostridiales bacterium]
MRRERRDGLTINEKAVITEDKKQDNILSVRIFQAAAILVGCFAFCASFLEAIPLTRRTGEVILLGLLCAGCVFVLCLWKEHDKNKLLAGTLGYLVVLAWQLKALKNGFYYLENIILRRVEEYYGYLTAQYTVNYGTLERDSFLLMVMILVPVVSLLVIAVVRNRFAALAGLLLLLPVIATFLFGLVPSQACLVSYVITALYLGRSSNTLHYATNRRQRSLLHRIHSKAAVWLSGVSILLFMIMRLFLTEEEYDGITEINKTKTMIQTALFNFSWEDFVSIVTSYVSMDGAAGGINGGKLGGVDRVEFDNSEQLEILSNYGAIKEGIYLKGYVGSVYTGHRWLGHSTASDKLYDELVAGWGEEPFFAINDVQRLIGALTKSAHPNRAVVDGLLTTDYYASYMQIQYREANRKYLYAPYYSEYHGIPAVNFDQDLYASLKGREKSYMLPFYYYQRTRGKEGADITLDLDADSSGNLVSMQNPLQVDVDSYSKEYETGYRQFVRQVYTRLPEEGVEQLIEEFEPLRDDKEYDNVFEKITYVRDYLRDNVDYSLEPGKTPWDKDFVEYFLYENKKGYCAHFASAATLMLRAMGVPARYVEGYAVSANAVMRNLQISSQLYSSIPENSDTSSDVTTSPAEGAGVAFSPSRNVVRDGDMVTVVVRDYSAHSWVEVYMDGCGWIPVDFTPGSEMGISAVSNIGKSSDEDNKATPTPKPATPTPGKKNETQKEENRTDNTEEQGRKENNLQVKWIVAIIIVIWLAATGLGIAAVAITSRIIRKRTKDPDKKAILIYGQIERVLKLAKATGKDKNALLEENTDYVKEHCPYLDAEEFEVVMEIIRRARFGRNAIAPEELQQVEEFYIALKETLWAELSLPGKMYLKLRLLL